MSTWNRRLSLFKTGSPDEMVRCIFNFFHIIYYNFIDNLFLFKRVEFIQQQDFFAKFTNNTRHGVVTRNNLIASAVIDIGKIIRVHFGKRAYAYAVLLKGFWLRSVHNHVILGPLALLNHACRAHCNVDCEYVNNKVIVIRDVDAGENFLLSMPTKSSVDI